MDDLTGRTFNNLKVLYRIEDYVSPSGVHKSRWHCKCECGNECDVISDNLRTGNTKTCGCTKTDIDSIVGKDFYDWKVIKEVEPKFGKRKFLCRCKCGNEKEVYASHLIHGNSKSCGKCKIPQYQDLCGQAFGYLKVLRENKSRYTNKTHCWDCECMLCGSITTVSTNSLHRGNTSSCGCLKSKGEQFIADYLNKNNINFKKEFTFSDLKSSMNKSLRFDFAIFDNDKILFLIEYQGEQHFRNTFYYSQDEWKRSKDRDLQKILYCKDNNIPLYIINYDENLEQKLEEIVNENKRFG